MQELKYGRKAPKSGKAKSIVVFLHGYGADGADLLSIGDVLADHLPDTLFVAPDAPQPCAGNPFGRQWFPIPRFDGSSDAEMREGLAASVAALNDFLDVLLQGEGLGPEALALVGFSQGAMMSLHVAPRRAAALAGIVAISGRLMEPEKLGAELKVKPPVILIHGDEDDVVPFDSMRMAGDALLANDFEVYSHVMRGMGHGISPDGLGASLNFLKDHLPK